MQKFKVQSSFLAAFAWIPETRTPKEYAELGRLRVWFKAGQVRDYLNVPLDVFGILMAAPSKGRAYNQYVKWARVPGSLELRYTSIHLIGYRYVKPKPEAAQIVINGFDRNTLPIAWR